MESKLLRLWIETLRAYKPKVGPESSHFDSVIAFLEDCSKEGRPTPIASDGDLAACDCGPFVFRDSNGIQRCIRCLRPRT